MAILRYMVVLTLFFVALMAVCSGAAYADETQPAIAMQSSIATQSTITAQSLDAGNALPAAPSPWAEEQVRDAIAEGIVPEGMNSNYGQEAPSPWAEEQVWDAIAEGIVPEGMNSNYGQAATRAEFAALAVAAYEKAMGEIVGRFTFIDSNDTNVEKAAFVRIVIGVGGNRFDPDSPLTREMAAVMLSNLADALEEPFARQPPTFADNDSVATWATEGVGGAQAAGIMLGIGGNLFAPQQPYTREQSIVTIMRMIDYINERASDRIKDGVPGGEIDFDVQYVRAYLSYVGLDQPLVVAVSTAEELIQFYETILDILSGEGNQAVMEWASGSADAIEKYDDDFFAEKYLVLIFIEETSGSIRHRVERIEVNGNIFISRIVPEIGTTDIAQWLIVVELEKGFRPDQFKAVFDNVRK